jgi:hypothetical protein
MASVTKPVNVQPSLVLSRTQCSLLVKASHAPEQGCLICGVGLEKQSPLTDGVITACLGALIHEALSRLVGFDDRDRLLSWFRTVTDDDHGAFGAVLMPIETRGLCAAFDPVTGSMTVWAAHQAPYHLRSVVAARLGLPAESVRVIAPDTGGGFGPKEGIYPADVLVPLLAHHLGRPVKWILTRTEFLSSSHQARQQAHHDALAVRDRHAGACSASTSAS